jgi:hypothetical protein
LYQEKRRQYQGKHLGQCFTECENFLSHQDPLLEKTQAALCVWLEDEAQKGLPVSGDVVREKATQLYRGWATSMSVNGSLKILQSRWGLHNMKTGEWAPTDMWLAVGTQRI